jgi:hypothetical protein
MKQKVLGSLGALQIIWWSFWDRQCWKPLIIFWRCTGGMASVYVWTLNVGPVELRKWKSVTPEEP